MDFEERPRLKVPPTPLSISIDGISLIAIILTLAYLVMHYNQLPEEIPRHFDHSGKPDGMGKRTLVWVIFSIQVLLFAGLYGLTKVPHLLSATEKITEANAPRLYAQGTLMLRVTNMLCMLLFGSIIYQTIQVATGEWKAINNLFTWTLIGLTTVLPMLLALFYHWQNKSRRHT